MLAEHTTCSTLEEKEYFYAGFPSDLSMKARYSDKEFYQPLTMTKTRCQPSVAGRLITHKVPSSPGMSGGAFATITQVANRLPILRILGVCRGMGDTLDMNEAVSLAHE